MVALHIPLLGYLFFSRTMIKKPELIFSHDASFLVLHDREMRIINVSQITSVTNHYDRHDKAVVYIRGLSKPFQTDYEVHEIARALNTITKENIS